MRHTRIITTALGVALGAAGVHAASDWLQGSTDERLGTLARIQPGLGTVMIEYGARYTNLLYAGRGGNWELAAYQLKEMREIQEVGETTRPARAQALRTFEASFLEPLEAAVRAKDRASFERAFTAGIGGCNECHVAEGFAYIRYELPTAPTFPLSMTR